MTPPEIKILPVTALLTLWLIHVIVFIPLLLWQGEPQFYLLMGGLMGEMGMWYVARRHIQKALTPVTIEEE